LQRSIHCEWQSLDNLYRIRQRIGVEMWRRQKTSNRKINEYVAKTNYQPCTAQRGIIGRLRNIKYGRLQLK
jgi:hypothetical protein